MKTLGTLLLIILFFACASQHETTKKGRLWIKDSTQYELIVFDPGFEYWFSSRKSLVKMHNNHFYQITNYRYAQEWNKRYATGDPNINSYIDYRLRTNYGINFNYKLYMYFKYFEETNKTKLINGSGSL